MNLLRLTPATILAATFLCAAGFIVLLNKSGVDISVFRTLYTVPVGTDGAAHSTNYNPLAFLGITIVIVAALGAFSGAMHLLARSGRLSGKVLSWQSLRTFVAGLLGQGERKRVEGEMTRVAEILRKLIDTNGSYAGQLGKFSDKIRGQMDAQVVSSILNELLAEHQRSREETTQLLAELENKTAEKQAVEQQLSQAKKELSTDALTNIGNRRTFDQELTAAITSCQEGARPLALVLADIDHFKRINDEHGHQVGDEVIKMLARIIQSTVRDTDVATRYGGEEFALILPGTGLEAAKSVAERIRKKFESRKLTLRHSGQSIGKVTASFGVAELRFGDNATILFQRADRKLYAAKSAGRNRVSG